MGGVYQRLMGTIYHENKDPTPTETYGSIGEKKEVLKKWGLEKIYPENIKRVHTIGECVDAYGDSEAVYRAVTSGKLTYGIAREGNLYLLGSLPKR